MGIVGVISMNRGSDGKYIEKSVKLDEDKSQKLIKSNNNTQPLVLVKSAQPFDDDEFFGREMQNPLAAARNFSYDKS